MKSAAASLSSLSESFELKIAKNNNSHGLLLRCNVYNLHSVTLIIGFLSLSSPRILSGSGSSAQKSTALAGCVIIRDCHSC